MVSGAVGRRRTRPGVRVPGAARQPDRLRWVLFVASRIATTSVSLLPSIHAAYTDSMVATL